MKTGYSFGSLVNLVETIDRTTVKLSGDQTIDGLKGFNQNPYTNAAQGQGGGYLTRKDYVDNALSYKANTDSPTFTGNPTAPTAPLFDADTSVATTQFVQRALGNHQQYVWTGDATLQPTWVGSFVWYAGAGALYLPDYHTVPMGSRFDIMWTGGGRLAAQTGQILFLPNGASVDSVTPNIGDTVAVVRLDAGWAYSGTNYTPTAAASDNSTRPASTAHVKNYLLSSPQLAGNVHVEGVVNATGEYQTTNAISYRMVYGNYGSFWYFDGYKTYLMFTNSGDQWGGFNELRPFSADCATGRVTIGNGLTINRGLYVDSEEVGSNLVVNGHIDGKQYAFINGSWWRDSQPFSVTDNYSCSAVYDVYAQSLPLSDSFFPIVGASADTLNEGYVARVKFGVYSNGAQSGWARKHAGIWVGSGESPSHPHYLYKFNAYGGFYAGAVVSDTTIVAGTDISAGGTISAPYLISTAVDKSGLRFTGGPYGVMCYNGSDDNFYFLLTNANDSWGGFNTLRPLIINKRTGEVSHRHGLAVNGTLAVDYVVTNYTLTVAGNITSSGSVIGKSSFNNIPMGVTSYARGGLSYSLGVSADARPFMILMCPQYSGSVRNKSGMCGRITLSRGSTTSGLIDRFVDFSIVGGYADNLFEIYHQNAGARIVITTYNSVSYYALYFDTMSSVDVLFDGIRYDQDFTPILIQDASGYSGGTVHSGELYARLSSPTFIGVPTTPTAAADTSTSQIASTAFVQSAIKRQAAQTVIYEGNTSSLSFSVYDKGPTGNRMLEIFFSDNTNTPTNWASKTISTEFFRRVTSGSMFVDYGDSSDYIFDWTTLLIDDTHYTLNITRVYRGALRYVIGIA